MSRDTSQAVPDDTVPALVPATITSFLDEPSPRDPDGVGLGERLKVLEDVFATNVVGIARSSC